MKQERTASARQSPIRRLLEAPYLNGWGFIVGAISLIFAGFTYWDGQVAPNLVTQINPFRATFISSEGINSFKVYKDERKIEGPISAAQLVVWNAGRQPIKQSDILEPIRIHTSSGSRIHSVQIQSVVRSVSGISAAPDATGVGVEVTFRILEQGDGALLQIIYEGDENVTFNVTGSVVGQRSLDAITAPKPKEKTNLGRPHKALVFSFVTIWIVMILAFLRYPMISWLSDSLARLHTSRVNHIGVTSAIFGLIGNIGFVLLMLVILGFMGYSLINEVLAPQPPLGFAKN